MFFRSLWSLLSVLATSLNVLLLHVQLPFLCLCVQIRSSNCKQNYREATFDKPLPNHSFLLTLMLIGHIASFLPHDGHLPSVSRLRRYNGIMSFPSYNTYPQTWHTTLKLKTKHRKGNGLKWIYWLCKIEPFESGERAETKRWWIIWWDEGFDTKDTWLNGENPWWMVLIPPKHTLSCFR